MAIEGIVRGNRGICFIRHASFSSIVLCWRSFSPLHCFVVFSPQPLKCHREMGTKHWHGWEPINNTMYIVCVRVWGCACVCARERESERDRTGTQRTLLQETMHYTFANKNMCLTCRQKKLLKLCITFTDACGDMQLDADAVPTKAGMNLIGSPDQILWLRKLEKKRRSANAWL